MLAMGRGLHRSLGKRVTIKLSKARKITEITFERLHLHNLLKGESQTVNKGEHSILQKTHYPLEIQKNFNGPFN